MGDQGFLTCYDILIWVSAKINLRDVYYYRWRGVERPPVTSSRSGLFKMLRTKRPPPSEGTRAKSSPTPDTSSKMKGMKFYEKHYYSSGCRTGFTLGRMRLNPGRSFARGAESCRL